MEMKNSMNFLKMMLPIIIFSVACSNADYERTSNGLIYKIHKVGKGPKIKPRSYLKVHQAVSLDDTVFANTFEKVPLYGFFDSLTAPTHDFLDILHLMNVGDSAIVIRSVDTLVNQGLLNYSGRFKKGSAIKVVVKVLEVLPSDQAIQQDQKKEMDAYKKIEIAQLEKYIEGLKLKGISKKPEGVFVHIEKEGNGPKVEQGDNVTIYYTGKLTNGTVFDSNLDSTFGHPEPFKYSAGFRQVIEGWDVGVMNLKQGTKAKLFIPSMLAYGMQGQGPKLPPYSNLVFDIEVLSVQKAAYSTNADSSKVGSGL